MDTVTISAFGTYAADRDLEKIQIERRQVQPHDVKIEILYCGVCHSDLHTARNDWGGSKYPVVPGHEIVGKIVEVGSAVTSFKIGDSAAVGCIVDSCRHCLPCTQGQENYCEKNMTGTYNGRDNFLNTQTFGGYSQHIVVDQKYILRVPENLPLDAVAPLLCAGITTWSPLKHWNVSKGSRVAVVGLGGLGHMAIKLAKGLGAEVTLFSRSPEKTEDAKKLGADHVILSYDDAAMKNAALQFDLIIDTVPYEHDLNPYISTLGVGGTLVLVGYLGPLTVPVNSVPLIMKRRSVAGSLIGGIRETQEMLDFCGKNNIVADIELIRMQDINKAYERMLKSDVKYRFVIDMATLS